MSEKKWKWAVIFETIPTGKLNTCEVSVFIEKGEVLGEAGKHLSYFITGNRTYMIPNRVIFDHKPTEEEFKACAIQEAKECSAGQRMDIERSRQNIEFFRKAIANFRRGKWLDGERHKIGGKK